MRTDILGVPFDNVTMEQAVETSISLIENHSRAYAVTPNPEIVMLCRDDERLAEIIRCADLVLADGIGVIIGGKILGTPIKQKIPGIDFAEQVIAELARRGMSVYLLGAKPSVAEEAGRRLALKYPGLVIAGTHDGYFADDRPVIEAINAVRPDLLLVCLGAPKQEYWISDNRDKLDVGLMAGLGGSLDVFAGKVERAPKTWQKLGLEWLYRLIKEPKRIKRMAKLPLFIFAAVGRRIRGK